MSCKHRAFAIWLTGLPGSGKSTLAEQLHRQLLERGVDAAVLTSDGLRQVLTPQPTYSPDERDRFYHALIHIGSLLVDHHVPVIFDATANRRQYRDAARQRFACFLEVYVDTPLAVCRQRDPKGLYAQADQGRRPTLPGVGAPYEPPERPDLVVHGDRETPEAAAARIVTILEDRKILPRVIDQ